MHSWLQNIDKMFDGTDFDERQSDYIADTVGGRTKTQIEQRRKSNAEDKGQGQKQSFADTNKSARSQQRQRLSEVQQNGDFGEHLYNRKNNSIGEQQKQHRSLKEFMGKPITNAEAEALGLVVDRTLTRVDRRPRRSLSVGEKDKNVSMADTELLAHHQQKIREHPQLGDGAQRLLGLVQQPFKAQFGTSSTREWEHQRAGSALPLISPFFRDEPVIIANSPLKPADEEEHPALKEPAPNAGVKQTQDERVSTGRSQQRSASTQTNTEETEIKHHQQNGMRANDFGNRRKSTDQHSVREMRHSSSDRFSSSPASMHHYRRDRQYYEKPEHYSPLYDYSHKPYVPKPMHVEKLDTKYYYRLYLDRAMHDFRKLNSLVKQLDEDSSSKLNDECKRHADELRVLEKKKELDIREWSLKLREREVEERERYRSSSTSTPIPPTHSILKSASYSHPTAQWSSHQSQNGGSSGRVNFASPLYTAKEITPNTSMNISSGTVSGVAKTQAQPPIGQSQPFVARHQPCRHPLHRRSTSVTAKHKDKAPSEMPRVVLKNRANIGKYGVRPQSPLVRTPSPPRMSPSPRDPLADRENVSGRRKGVMREIEQRAERERVRREAVCGPNRGNAPLPNKLAARPAPPSAKPTAYPGSMFSYISLPKNK